MKEFDLVQVFAGTSVEAEMVKSILLDSGIEVFIKDEHMGTMFPFHTAPGAAGSVKLVVPNKSYEMAMELVKQYYDNIKA